MGNTRSERVVVPREIQSGVVVHSILRCIGRVVDSTPRGNLLQILLGRLGLSHSQTLTSFAVFSRRVAVSNASLAFAGTQAGCLLFLILFKCLIKDDVRDETLLFSVTIWVRPSLNDSLDNSHLGIQSGLNLSQLDTESSHFHLVIQTAKALQHSSGSVPPHKIASRVHLRTLPLKRARNESIHSQVGSPEVSRGEPLASNPQLSG
mmetsp:Transcript_29895/g.41373  ORF Transcript_29895/g.41373 Transcript_29895/m.41373 type:complete len:206 (-) Transcript_29895:2004-2621(-)